ncbi:hypothetical protein A2625_04295 [candidate division WOR-1 bacterium RIFCSPHIGHO2_01_FULL_53_15]|uniref:DUF2283 domain-containing protein n=1 Tax=candidate division WOR-1 bacterium RIFCSPHIGHO2_01_FULL_53_15 TaxID=1802564 RepID=A0A1F4Q2N8_UNCSA|nr:MAG: hypothetical protein A2625_04295 [candidate division WOR-1 bacterium RIFCSPHIGHO2_01_FULL_53_15]
MGKEVAFYYDSDEDILDISVGKPRRAVSTEISDDFFVRKDVKTHKIVGFSVLNFEKWFKGKKEERTVPISANFHLVK